ncbi:MAG: dihydroorotase [Bacteroidales bacterium]|nr:dihydroorotase [Bacteroidales bacterium]
MRPLLIEHAQIVNEGTSRVGSLWIREGEIAAIYGPEDSIPSRVRESSEHLDATGQFLLPGVIDDHVHFREPGLTHKADMGTESRAAIAGGVTSFMEMPNTQPPAVSHRELEKKFSIAGERAYANYSFYLGATNDNIEEVRRTDPARVCGIKLFMGASTGNMLVDNAKALEQIFEEAPVLIACHCEDEGTIRANTNYYQKQYGDDIPAGYHSRIRSEEACYLSSSRAVELARKHGARLHVLHLSTARELDLFEPGPYSPQKKVTAEACVHHLWFHQDDYGHMGTRIKWNPAIKSLSDRDGLRQAITDNRIDVVATDHAPHLSEEKDQPYMKAPSGGPMIQHSLQAMLELHLQGAFTMETLVEKMCHTPARLFHISKRGFIRPGYWADLVLVDPRQSHQVQAGNLYYKCGWSPMEGQTFHHTITHTLVNGKIVYQNGQITGIRNGSRLLFEG